ncbi:hypothetical protein NP493_18g06013 [Ridgeia piscesae]|uniref:Uncharacterized protein n=1 Tax=Ridgeia piscesae TaxID=27915 RepID=A0AAD9PE20_RIDPI|nr:hypothetical protein NP493_18g06013 [Ridgeia piscesae]
MLDCIVGSSRSATSLIAESSRSPPAPLLRQISPRSSPCADCASSSRKSAESPVNRLSMLSSSILKGNQRLSNYLCEHCSYVRIITLPIFHSWSAISLQLHSS